jgi:hypothetical protein
LISDKNINLEENPPCLIPIGPVLSETIVKAYGQSRWTLFFCFILQVRELQTQITEAEFEHERLENENIQLQSELDNRVSLSL